jgi:tetratricopeptide (TPR) repeat protein
MEESQTQLEVYRERVAKYPTDLRLKFLLGRVLFQAREFDEAIPILQAAQDDPRSRYQCRLMMGRAFLEKENYAQAVDVLKELLGAYELTDELSKEATYWLARAQEAGQQLEEAKATYRNLLRQDYNYAGGDARQRLEELNKRQ